MTGIDEEGAKALQGYFASCSVVITSETPGFQHGTGVAVRYKDQDYIVTAAHVLAGEPSNEKILIIGRPASTLKEVQKSELPSAFFAGTHGRPTASPSTHITITGRLASKGQEDIAALKVQNAKNDLPHTVFHNLSGQETTDVSEGKLVIICGSPGELALHAQHRVTGKIGVAVFLYCAWQKIMAISESPEQLDPNVDFVTDFIHNQDPCDPQGMSGGGAWTIPKIKDGELWVPHKTQLLGIQSGFYRERKLLKLVRIERVLDMLSGKHLSQPV